MKKRRLGDSDLEVSEISLGSWLTYSGGVERDQTEACTRAAFDAGINFFDTANAYGDGASETAWGEILSDYPRDSYVLATKVFFPMREHRQRAVGRADRTSRSTLSLERLQTDYVDLYQCHRFDADDADRGDDGGAQPRSCASGKARYLGFSEWTPEQIQRRPRRSPARASSSPPSRSTRRSGARPRPRSSRSAPSNGISQIVWSPLAQGVLTGKYKPGEQPPADSRAASDAMSTFIDRA